MKPPVGPLAKPLQWAVYHGTNSAFEKFNLAFASDDDEAAAGKAIYFTTDQATAEHYARRYEGESDGAPRVIDAVVCTDRCLYANEPAGLAELRRIGAWRDALLAAGYDAVVFDDWTAGRRHTSVAALRPRQISIIQSVELAPQNDTHNASDSATSRQRG